MEEIKVGEYVRTKKGYIGKVIDISNVTGQQRKKYLIKWNISKAYYITSATITKHSPNPIDLIEVGDYVNGYKVRATYLDGARHYIKLEPKDKKGTRVYDEDIKSIVTKEVFQNAEYTVEAD